MKRFLIFSLSLSCFGASLLFAQTKKTRPAPVNQVPKSKYKSAPVFLGNSDLRQGMISKRAFDSLIAQGLTARDSSGATARVSQFILYYKERNLYEDSLGNYYMGTELLTDFSKSNKLNEYIGVGISEKTKKGDTAIFDDIVVVTADSAVTHGLPMKFVITK